MKVTLLITSFNGLSQLIYTYLKEQKNKVDIVFINSFTRDKEIVDFEPDIILSPYLVHKVPSSIYEKYPTFIFHPGVVGDRGAYSLENVVAYANKSWGVVILKANDVWDGGEIYAHTECAVRQSTKASLYRSEIKSAFFLILDSFFQNIKEKKSLPQSIKLLNTNPNLKIEWERDSSDEIVRKINTYDSFPGIEDEILGLKVHLFGAHKEERLKADKVKEIVAKRDGAICLATTDGAVWVSHLKTQNGFKLPATYVLKEKIEGVKEQRLPLIFDKSYKTFYEISCDVEDNVAYLYFNFHNGAFSAAQAVKLKYAFEYIKEQVDMVVLMGGDDFFSNGIHLNILEESKKNGEDGWSNINAMNDLIESVLFADDIITVASLSKNAGAGGVFLAIACDFIVMQEDVVLNPHYKTMGLSGSEYHSYTLSKRVGMKEANKMLKECLPVGARRAKKSGLVDVVFGVDEYMIKLQEYCQEIADREDFIQDFLWEKEEFLEQNKTFIEQHREEEIAIMYPEFWEKESNFHTLRYEFVHKICPTKTPQRLKVYNNE
ncbi:enoyl-CoA hydratase-related protein [Sulfurimonas sp.]